MQKKLQLMLSLVFCLCFMGFGGEAGQLREATVTEDDLIAGCFLPMSQQQRETYQALFANSTRGEDTFESVVVDGLKKLSESIDVSQFHIQVADFSALYSEILNRHAELFYVLTQWSYSYSSSGVVSVKPSYTTTDTNVIATMASAVDAAVAHALATVDDGASDLEKALVLHDYLATHCDYDTTLNRQNCRNIYGAFCEKSVVCAGYAKAYMYLLSLVGVEADYVVSDELNHAWNFVTIDGQGYHVDVTWDDPLLSGGVVNKGYVQHVNFLRNDSGIQSTEHTAWNEPARYSCSNNRFEEYFWQSAQNFPIPCRDGRAYAVVSDALKEYALATGQGKTLVTIDDTWYVWGKDNSYWPGVFSCCQLYRGLLLYNTSKELYLYDGNAGRKCNVELPIQKGYLYGLFTENENDTLEVCVAQSPNEFPSYVPIPWVKVSKVSLDQTEVSLALKDTQGVFLKASVMPANATCKEVIWTSSDENIASVDENGHVIPKASGKAVITVTTVEGGYSASCNVTVSLPKCTIGIQVSPASGGTVQGAGTYELGVNVKLKASPAVGYDFVCWKTAGKKVSTQKEYTVQSSQDITYVAEFAVKVFNIQAVANNMDFGQVSCQGTKEYGAPMTLTATPKAGYVFKEWRKDGQIVSTSATYAFKAYADGVYTGCFEPMTYQVSGKQCNVSVAQAAAGTTVTVAADMPGPKEEYDLTWKVVPDSVVITPDAGDFSKGSFVMPASDVTVTAVVIRRVYLLTVVNGSSVKKNVGDSVTVTAPKKDGYSFKNWTASGVTLTDNAAETITFTMPARDVTLTANYMAESYTLTVDGQSEAVECGATVTKTAPEKDGYSFKEWIAEGVILADKKSSTVTFTMPACDVKLESEFTINVYKLMIDGKESDTEYGAQVQVSAEDKPGYTFVKWSVSGVDIVDETSVTLSFTMPARDVTLTANYTAKSYTLTVDGQSEKVECGATVTKTAPEKDGYSFKEWIAEGVILADKKSSTVTFTMPACDVKLESEFTINVYKLMIDGKESDKEYGAQVQVSAEDKPGYTFVKWSVSGVDIVDETSVTLSFTMPAHDVTLKSFYEEQGKQPPENWKLPADDAPVMTVFGKVFLATDEFAAEAVSMVAAFDDKGVCRGVGAPDTDMSAQCGCSVYRLLVAGDGQTKGLSLKFWSQAEGAVLDLVETLEVAEGAVVGDSHPLTWNAVRVEPEWNFITLELKPGWNMVASVLKLSPESIRRMMEYPLMLLDGEGYAQATPKEILPGRGLLFYNPEPIAIELTLKGKTVDDWQLEVAPGWQFIGVVKDIPSKEIPANVEEIFGWDPAKGGFKRVQNLASGAAYWVKGK